MGFDIRVPIGLMFALLGVILTAYGAVTQFTNKEMYKRSLGINLNLWWGLVILAFGAVMLLLAWRAAGKRVGASQQDIGEAQGSGKH